jgi:hypothetical protein
MFEKSGDKSARNLDWEGPLPLIPEDLFAGLEGRVGLTPDAPMHEPRLHRNDRKTASL